MIVVENITINISTYLIDIYVLGMLPVSEATEVLKMDSVPVLVKNSQWRTAK